MIKSTMSSEKERVLRQLKKEWLTPSKGLAFAGRNAIYDKYKDVLTMKDIEDFLASNYSYTRFRMPRKMKRRNPIYVYSLRRVVGKIKTNVIKVDIGMVM